MDEKEPKEYRKRETEDPVRERAEEDFTKVTLAEVGVHHEDKRSNCRTIHPAIKIIQERHLNIFKHLSTCQGLIATSTWITLALVSPVESFSGSRTT